MRGCARCLESHLERIHTFIQGRLLETLWDFFRFDYNQALSFLKTLLSDSLWHYRVKELHAKDRSYHIATGCFLCEWEPIGMCMDGLVEYVIDIGLYDEPPNHDTEDETPPPPPGEDTEVDESVGENELEGSEDELEAEPIEEGNPREEPSAKYEAKEDLDTGKDHEEEPLDESDREEDLMEEDDPKDDLEEDPEEEPLEENDPEEDPIEEKDPEEELEEGPLENEEPKEEPLEGEDPKEDQVDGGRSGGRPRRRTTRARGHPLEARQMWSNVSG